MSGEKQIIEAQSTAAPVPAVSPVPHVLSVLSVPSSVSPLMTISRKRNRHHPPNCTICDLNPSRFLAFRRKQNEVEAEYGFRLGVPRRTDAERDGYSRYMRDWRRRYGEAHREARKAYRHAYWLNVTKRGFDSIAEAVRHPSPPPFAPSSSTSIPTTPRCLAARGIEIPGREITPSSRVHSF